MHLGETERTTEPLGQVSELNSCCMLTELDRDIALASPRLTEGRAVGCAASVSALVSRPETCSTTH